jgi:hypothetical protein
MRTTRSDAGQSFGFLEQERTCSFARAKPANPSSNAETFNDFDAAHWTDIMQRLDRVMKDLETEVEKIPEEKLARSRRPFLTSARTTRITPGKSSMSASCRDRGIPKTALSKSKKKHLEAQAVFPCPTLLDL